MNKNMSQQQALSMFLEECDLRKSDDIQKMYDENNNDGYVEDVVQTTLLHQFGYEPSGENLNVYRYLIGKYRQVLEVRDKVFFMKNNIMRQGTLKVDDIAPDADLLDLNKESHCLQEFMNEKPLVILSGSLT